MSTMEPMSLAGQVLRELFLDADTPLYAILDGARVPELRAKLAEWKPEHCCLYRGPMPDKLEAAAPYLVRLEPDGPMAAWLATEGWGKAWGVYAQATADLREMRKHCRTFLRVRRYDGPVMLFRYYDPRVLRVYLPTCNAGEMMHVYGPVTWWACESEQPGELLKFPLRQDAERVQRLDLTAGGLIAVEV